MGEQVAAQPVDIEPTALAELLRGRFAELLAGFDVDGVLAPIVEHADDARLTDGVSDALARLASKTEVAILSGRSLADLERLFAFPAGIHVIGSHGLETRGAGDVRLGDDERRLLDRLEELGQSAVRAAGDGAWLEHKPASVVVHTRSADQRAVAAVVDDVTARIGAIEGAQIKPGHHVIELLARSASKGEALLALARRLGRTSLSFVGDDVTDEEAFVLMGRDDVSVRVGRGDTAARFRLGDPDAVAELLARLAE